LTDPRSEYSRRAALWDEAIARGERVHLLVSNLRLVAAAIGALVAWLAFGRQALSPMWLLVAFAAFLALVLVHARVLQRNERAVRARGLYRRGLDRIDDRWMHGGADGARFMEGHPYARDVDLFGPASLFQLVNTARTEAGEDRLAQWLGQSAAAGEVRERQAGVAELAPQVDFREQLGVVAAEAHVGRSGALASWAALSPVGLSLAAGGLHALCGLVTAVLLVAAFTDRVPIAAVGAWLLVHTGVALAWRQRVNEAARRIGAASSDLGLFREVLEAIERTTFSAPALAAIHARLKATGVPSSRRISRLESFVSLLELCDHNPYFRAIAVPLLVRGPVAAAIDLWHARNRLSLSAWIDAVGEFEAFASLATYAYEHPGYPFPSMIETSADGPLLHADALAHPLLPASAVPNDVRLGGDAPSLLIISGSNMSGKSTLLRAVGLNAALALAGAPVRASRFVLSPVTLGATIRVEDSLLAGHSRFYTEVLRIRAIVQLASGALPVLFLLDEILHGTNSHDRRIGAEAILRTLVKAGAIGLVTTHDLALTQAVGIFDGNAANVHFQDRIEDGKMAFDYRMRPGIVEHSNALELMRAVGLDV
jgi:hypothetical protein